MKVKLIDNVMEGTHVKTTIRRNKRYEEKMVPSGNHPETGEVLYKIETNGQPKEVVTPFVKGAVVDCSRATGLKWIEKKIAEEVVSEAAVVGAGEAP